MKKRLLVLLLLLIASLQMARSQDDLMLADTLLIEGDTIIMRGDSLIIKQAVIPVYWKSGGNFNLSIQQVSLTNWAAGGSSNLAMNSGLSLFANFAKDKKIWDRKLTVNFVFNRQRERVFSTRKTNDNFIFLSKYGRELTQFWFLSTQIDARTQLLSGYRYFKPSGSDLEARTKISDLLSPAYIQSSTGLNYKREFANKDKVSVIGSPFTGRFTIVMEDSLRNAGAFGVMPGETIRPEAGVSVTSSTDIQLLENIRWKADLNLFSNYEKLGNIVVNFNSIINMKVNRYITTRIETILIYDERVMISQKEGPAKQAIQLQNLINFGIGIDF